MIYKLMPRVQVQLARRLARRASSPRCCSRVGKFLIGLYIGKSGVASGFGAAGSLVVVFVWVYYSAQIFLLGAEFTWVYAQDASARCAASEGSREVGAEGRAAPTRYRRAAQIRRSAADRARRERGAPRLAPRAGAGAAATLGDVGAGVAVLCRGALSLPRLLRRL